MTPEMLQRFYVELTHPDELGMTDPRIDEVFALARKALLPEEGTAKDAARYRFLKAEAFSDYRTEGWEGAMWKTSIHDPQELGMDEAIDAAIASSRLPQDGGR